MSTTLHTSSLSPPPDQQDQSARLAASAEVPGQEGGTICLELFHIWLETKAQDSVCWMRAFEPLRYIAEDVFKSEAQFVSDCRIASRLLEQYLQEQRA